jgi:hypothetical protein
LRHIRDPKSQLIIWADGICINQVDIEEKTAQVRHMGSIYELATHTIIFLGEATEGSAAVMNALLPTKSSFNTRRGSGLLLNASRVDVSVAAYRSDIQLVGKRWKQWEGGMIPGSLSHETKLNNIQRLAEEHILQRPWFARVWVLQELILSPDPWVQLGTCRVRWNVFCAQLLSPPPRPPNRFQGRLGLLFDMHNARKELGPAWFLESRHHSKMNDIFQILRSRRGFGVADPRDMIYAYMGIIKPYNGEENLLTQVDYTKSVRELYTEVAVAFLHSSRHFEFLTHVEDIPLENRRHRLPSWVPDWTSPYVSSQAPTDLRDCYGIRPTDFVTVLFKSSMVLGCIGIKVGVIEEILEDMPPKVYLQHIYYQVRSEFPSFEYNLTLITKEVYKILISHLRNWFKEHHLDCNLNEYFYDSLTKTLDKGLDPGLNYDPNSYDPSNNPIMRTISIFMGRRLRPSGPNYRGMLHDILLEMTDADGPDRFTDNIASLNDGDIGMVLK